MRELDLLRGLAVIFMIANHLGVSMPPARPRRRSGP